MTARNALPETFAFIETPDAEEGSRRAAALVADQLSKRPGSIVCAASGNTPTRTYSLLGAMAAQQQLTTSHMSIVKLDEWLDLPLADPHSCDTYIRRHLLGPLEIPHERYIRFDSQPADAQGECHRVATEIVRRGGIDLAILGIGINGHLGLNEPGPFAQPSCHVAQLAPATAGHSMLQGVTLSVRRGITLGIGDILKARHILLLAFGEPKAEAIGRLFEQEVSPELPASFLWLHPRVTCICDPEAAAGRTPSNRQKSG